MRHAEQPLRHPRLAIAFWRLGAVAHADQVLLHAAGSLRTAPDQIAAAYEKATGTRVVAKYGAPGTLREEIETGSRAEVSLARARRQARAGRPVCPQPAVCAGAPRLALEPASLLNRMMQRDLKLGTSRPKADPSGDYAREGFRKPDAIPPGAFAALSQEAPQLTGAPMNITAPSDRNLYGMLRKDAPISFSPVAPMRARRRQRIPTSAWSRCPTTWRSVPTTGSP